MWEINKSADVAGVESVAARREMDSLRSELLQAKQTIRLMHEREKGMKERYVLTSGNTYHKGQLLSAVYVLIQK